MVYFLRFASYLLPNWSIPDSITAGFDILINNVVLWNDIFPIEATAICIGVIISFNLAVYTAKGAIWFITLIRGGGSNLDL